MKVIAWILVVGSGLFALKEIVTFVGVKLIEENPEKYGFTLQQAQMGEHTLYLPIFLLLILFVVSIAWLISLMRRR